MSNLRHQFNAALAVAEATPQAMRAVDELAHTSDHPELLERAKKILNDLRELAQGIEAAWEEWP